ncbi:MAG: hypothetical protein GY835_15435 [bacterium]|nr:hypothetical protein [bacterium]
MSVVVAVAGRITPSSIIILVLLLMTFTPVPMTALAFGVDVTCDLREVWVRGTDDDDLIFGKISDIAAIGEHLAVMDSQLNHVLIFNMQGEYVGTLGEEGEGPGRLRDCHHIIPLDESGFAVFHGRPARLSEFSIAAMDWVDETGFQETTAAGQVIFDYRVMGDCRVAMGNTSEFYEGGMTQNYWLAEITAAGEIGRFHHQEEREFSFVNIVIDEERGDLFERRWLILPDETLVWVAPYTGYRIDRWRAGASLSPLEVPDYEPVVRPQLERDRKRILMERYSSGMTGAEIRISKHDPDIIRLLVGPEGRLWVLSSQGLRPRERELLCWFDVYDSAGNRERVGFNRPERTVDLVWDMVMFKGDYLFIGTNRFDALVTARGGGSEGLTEADSDNMQLVCYKLSRR